MESLFQPTLSLAGQRALVTGATRGIGLAIARRLVQGGAKVAVVGRDSDALRTVCAQLCAIQEQAAYGQILDVGNRGAVERVVPLLAEELGGTIDIVVNNAGIGGSTPLTDGDDSRWDAMLRVNLSGMMYVTRAALPFIPKGGRIVSLSSVLGKFGVPGYGGYCATKHAVIGWTRAVALELAERGITVNAICPGWVQTDMAENGIADTARILGVSAAAFKAQAVSQVPQRRFMDPAEIAELCAYLASPAAAAITGEAIAISAGTTPHS